MRRGFYYSLILHFLVSGGKDTAEDGQKVSEFEKKFITKHSATPQHRNIYYFCFSICLFGDYCLILQQRLRV